MDPRSRRLLWWTAVPVALGMARLAMTGTAVSFPTRRPGAPRAFTWAEAAVGFHLYSLMAYGVRCVIVLILKGLVRFAWDQMRLRRRGWRW